MKSLKYSRIKNHIVTSIFLVFAMLVMASPVLANSSNWWFLAYYDRYYLSGKANGVFHNMTAGNLTNSGYIYVTYIQGGTPSGRQPWYFEVWKKNTLVDKKICTSNAVYPNVMVGPNYKTNFSKNCGNISSGSYYLVIWRAASDNREVTGSGTLATP